MREWRRDARGRLSNGKGLLLPRTIERDVHSPLNIFLNGDICTERKKGQDWFLPACVTGGRPAAPAHGDSLFTIFYQRTPSSPVRPLLSCQTIK